MELLVVGIVTVVVLVGLLRPASAAVAYTPLTAPSGWRAKRAYEEGAEDVVEAAQAELAQSASALEWLAALNAVVNAHVHAGDYAEALRTADEAGDPTSELDERSQWDLIQVNAAEALYNLGRWRSALRRLERVDLEAGSLAADGVRIQRAWILAHRGDPGGASRALEGMGPWVFPDEYRSEVFFTQAVTALAAGEADIAAGLVRAGEKCARRVATSRNALFLLGRVERARARHREAEAFFRAGAEHPFRRQGGDGLLLWGDTLQRLGRGEDAREAWRLAAERDPQSVFARLARRRLRTPA